MDARSTDAVDGQRRSKVGRSTRVAVTTTVSAISWLKASAAGQAARAPAHAAVSGMIFIVFSLGRAGRARI
jgi:hypothetical protein